MKAVRVAPFEQYGQGPDAPDNLPPLPHNLEAERSVLGAILLHNDVFRIAEAVIETADFFRHAHRLIFDEMAKLAARNDAIDMITLKEELGRSANLDDVGGPAYISALIDGLPRHVNVDAYARIIKDTANHRQLIFAANKVLDAAYQGKVDAGALAEQASELFRVCTPKHGQQLAAAGLVDAAVVAAEGQQIAAEGVQYCVQDLIPNYGMLGMLVAYAKVGKTSFGQALATAVATGQPFLSRTTRQLRVLILAAEDPPEYTAWLARNLQVPPGAVTFWRQSLLLDRAGLRAIAGTIHAGGYGLVLISSWQAVIRGLLKDENDNAGAVRVVEEVKATARATGIPWLIDAHSGKGEDQADDADPSKAMRGASGAAAAADYTLSLRYDSSPFGTRRRLSGKGRFVNFDPIVVDCDLASSTYTVIGATKAATTETTWRLITETGALTTVPQTAGAIARAAGLSTDKNGKATAASRHQVAQALINRDGVRKTTETVRGQHTTLYQVASL